MSEALSLMDGLKTAVAEQAQQDGSIAGVSSGNNGVPAAADVKGKYVSGVAVAAGIITATMNNDATVNANIKNGTLVLTPQLNSGSVQWTCNSTTIKQRFLPKACSSTLG
jgi:type IV pilus assembly protein PilA